MFYRTVYAVALVQHVQVYDVICNTGTDRGCRGPRTRSWHASITNS